MTCAPLPCSAGHRQALEVGANAIVIGHGGLAHSLNVQVTARREYAGHWEYLLDDAIFTAPAHPEWGGTALVGTDGRLLGVGSLLVEESSSDETLETNLFVPVDLLDPILDDLLRAGRPLRPARPWLGMYATEQRGRLVVGALTQGGSGTSRRCAGE